MKKIIIALSIVLVLLVLITLIISRFIKNGQTVKNEQVTPIPPGTFDFQKSQNDQPSQNPDSPQIDENFKKTHQPVTLEDIDKLNQIKDKLPYDGENFSVEYNQETGKYLFSKNAPGAEQEIDDFLAKNGLSKINYKNSKLVEFVDKSKNLEFEVQQEKFKELDKELTPEEKQIIEKEFGVPPQSGIKKNKDVQLLIDLLNTLYNFNVEDTQPNEITPSQTIPTPNKKTTPGENYANTKGLLPDLLPDDLPTAKAQGQAVVRRLNRQPELIRAYKRAAAQSSLPWQLLAAIHYREGLSGSLQNGGPLGGQTLLASAIRAARELKGKARGHPLDNFQTLVSAVSRYNGGGNHNCGNGVGYGGPCPPPFGIDDPYAMNLFDSKHTRMRILYCADHVKTSGGCATDSRPGVITMFKYLVKNIQ